MRSKPSLWLTAMALLPALAAPVWSAPRPVGSEIRVNSNTESKQRNPVAAVHPSGRSIVVWENDKYGLRGRFFTRSGEAAGAELGLVANQTVPVRAEGEVVTRRDPAVAMVPSGDFFVFWTEDKAFLRVDAFIETRTPIDQDVLGQRFNGDGTAAGEAFRVNANSTGNQARPKVLSLTEGRTLVVWEAGGLFGRIISRNGQPIGDEFKINAEGGRQVQNAALAASSSGGFLVAWESCCGDGSGQGIFARLYDRNAVPVGSDIRVNTETAGIQRRPAVAADAAGGFLVVWQGQFGTVKQSRIFGQFIGAAGNLVGPQFRASEGNGVGDAHISPSVARELSGNYLVAWMDWFDIFPLGIYGVEIDRLGARVGDEIQINDARPTAHFRTFLSVGPAGELLMPYEAYAPNGGRGRGIAARRIATQ